MHEVVASLEPLVRPAGTVLIGEWHGTNEFPRLVESLVALAIERELPVVVGLELPCSEQPAIDRQAGLESSSIDGSWWHRADDFQDGRSSRAMARLIDYLTSRPSVTTVAMDGPWVAPGSAIPMDYLHLLEAPRDETMARHLLSAMDQDPGAVTFVLAGAEHVAVGSDASGRPTLGRYVTQWHPRTVGLLGRSSGGTAWGLQVGENPTVGEHPTGGPRPVPDDAELEPGAQWADRVGPDGYHGYVHVGPVTSSPPAYEGEGR